MPLTLNFGSKLGQWISYPQLRARYLSNRWLRETQSRSGRFLE